MLDPTHFWQREQFLKSYCKVEMTKGKKTFQYTGLSHPDYFHNVTKGYIIRRERSEVLPDLPKVFRTYSYSELGKQVEALYIKEMEEFQEAYENKNGHSAFQHNGNLLQHLNRMRHLTGRAKVIPTVDYLEEFLDSTNSDEKIVVFVHHLDVGQSLAMLLEERTNIKPLVFSSSLNSQERYAKIEEFKVGDNRVLIASTQAITGMNMQFCGHCIIMERQWTPSKEEQAEDRFPRPGSKHESIDAKYMVAIGTIDEFFAELVEQKSVWIKSALSAGKITQAEAENALTEGSLMKELMEILAQKGLKKWALK